MCIYKRKRKRREQTVILSADCQGLKCRCFSVFRVLSSLMASADSRGQHLICIIHFTSECLTNASKLVARLSVKSEYFSRSPAERRFAKLNQEKSFFLQGGKEVNY